MIDSLKRFSCWTLANTRKPHFPMLQKCSIRSNNLKPWCDLFASINPTQCYQEPPYFWERLYVFAMNQWCSFEMVNSYKLVEDEFFSWKCISSVKIAWWRIVKNSRILPFLHKKNISRQYINFDKACVIKHVLYFCA